MAIDLYQGFTNVITGESFRCISYDPSVIRFDWRVQPAGYAPIEHVHINQDEIFHVKEGEMKILIGGLECTVRAGESITIPKGTRHLPFNSRPDMLRCEVEYRPGLDTYKYFQCFGGLTVDKDVSKNGTVNIPKLLYFTRKMKAQCVARPASMPGVVFYVVLNLCYLMGRIFGWEERYLRYTQ